MIFILFLFTLLFLYIYVKYLYDFWTNRGFPSAKAAFLQGNIAGVGRTKNTAQALKEVYDEFREKDDFVGIYLLTSPALLLISPDLIKTILVKDFSSFSDRGMYHNKKDDPLSANLLTLHVEEWKRLRNKISPSFSTGKIKTMFNIISQITDNLVDKLLLLDTSIVNIGEIVADYSTDIISNIAFGLESNCLADSNSEIRKYGKEIFKMNPKRIMRFFFTSAFPKLATALRLTSTNSVASNYFLKLFIETVNYRERENFRRNDFMQILIDLKNSTEGSGLELSELAAESFAFFGGGFETTSTTITYALYEMAQNKEIQQQLRKEINANDLTYESLLEMKYLDMVVSETLRKYPIIPLTMRKCKVDYKIENTLLEIPKNTSVFVPILAIHHNPLYYPNPNKFDPERFRDDSSKSRPYYPFGDGPRGCIGKRFGLIQAKIAIAKLIKNFEFSISPKTEIPIKFNLSSPFITPQSDIYLMIQSAK